MAAQLATVVGNETSEGGVSGAEADTTGPSLTATPGADAAPAAPAAVSAAAADGHGNDAASSFPASTDGIPPAGPQSAPPLPPPASADGGEKPVGPAGDARRAEAKDAASRQAAEKASGQATEKASGQAAQKKPAGTGGGGGAAAAPPVVEEAVCGQGGEHSGGSGTTGADVSPRDALRGGLGLAIGAAGVVFMRRMAAHRTRALESRGFTRRLEAAVISGDTTAMQRAVEEAVEGRRWVANPRCFVSCTCCCFAWGVRACACPRVTLCWHICVKCTPVCARDGDDFVALICTTRNVCARARARGGAGCPQLSCRARFGRLKSVQPTFVARLTACRRGLRGWGVLCRHRLLGMLC